MRQGCSAPSDRDRVGIRDDQLGVDDPLEAEPVAALAGAVRRVEGEDPRLELGDRGAAVEAGEALAEGEPLGDVRRAACPPRPWRPLDDLAPASATFVSLLEDIDLDHPAGEARGRLDRLRQAAAKVLLHHQAVDHDRDVVVELLVELDLLVEPADLAVDADAAVALQAELLEQLLELALAAADHRRHDHEPGPLVQGHHPVGDLLDRLALDRLAALGAVRLARPAPRAGAGSRRSRSRCRPSSAGCARSSSGRSRSPARGPRSSPRPASPSGRGTGARRRRATRRSGAGPRRRSCRRRGSTCRTPRARSSRSGRCAAARGRCP